MIKKYKLTSESITYHGHRLYRIMAVRDFSDVRKGDLGGWIESERNLSQTGNCWIYDDGKCYDHALVEDDAKLYDCAEVYEEGLLCESAIIKDQVKVCGTSTVESDTVVSGRGKIQEGMISDQFQTRSEATFLSGKEFNDILFQLGWDKIKKILRSDKKQGKMFLGSTENSDTEILLGSEDEILFWYSEADDVFLNENSDFMFSNLECLVDICGIREINTEKTKSMRAMFHGCESLTETDCFSEWNVGNVVNFSLFFYGCKKLENLSGLKNWNISHAEDLSNMFCLCENLYSIKDLKDWNLMSAKDISGMFEMCSKLESLVPV